MRNLHFFLFFLALFLLRTNHEAYAQNGRRLFNAEIEEGKLTPDNISYYAPRDGLGVRSDYFWIMADGFYAVNRDVRPYRSAVYVFGSLFDLTGGDCDTEVYSSNGTQYRNLCVGQAGYGGRSFVDRHGGVVQFYANEH